MGHPLMEDKHTPDTGPVRVRLAPSPTGFLHIGHAFLAMIDAALAQRRGGQFLLRIEDTDQQRFVPEAEEVVYDGLRWLDLHWDEGPDIGGPYGPYRQSERLPRYQAVAEELVRKERAYYCWCSPERLEELRREQQARRQAPKYDRLCLGKTEAERKALGGYSERPVVRLLMPTEGESTFEDVIRGTISFENALIQDQIILKSDGFPTYHLAAITDDHDMEITHVLRGEEWIPSTPIHQQIYAAMGWPMPSYAHTPLLLNTDKSKISKRKHAWAKVAWFQEQGFLPEAVLNYLGNLAVLVPDPERPADASVRRELFGFAEIVEHLDLSKIGRSGKILDLERLDWLNGQYIRRLSLGELQDLVRPFMEGAGLHVAGDPKLPRALALEQERLKRLAEAPFVLSFFFRDEEYDPHLLIPKGLDQPRALELLSAAREEAAEIAAQRAEWTAPTLEARFRALAERLGLHSGRERGQLIGAGVVRVAVTGRTVGPPLFETMEVLGAETALRRMDAALQALRSLRE
jgi:glutamyl-tRNA synthetase